MKQKVGTIIQNIKEGEDKYFSYGHFDTDYTLMKNTISDMQAVYGITPTQAMSIVESLTH